MENNAKKYPVQDKAFRPHEQIIRLKDHAKKFLWKAGCACMAIGSMILCNTAFAQTTKTLTYTDTGPGFVYVLSLPLRTIVTMEAWGGRGGGGGANPSLLYGSYGGGGGGGAYVKGTVNCHLYFFLYQLLYFSNCRSSGKYSYNGHFQYYYPYRRHICEFKYHNRNCLYRRRF
jgi:hypothetical protein